MDNRVMDLDLLLDESLEKILKLIEEKKYFQARDELLKYNAVDIAELLEEITEETEIEMTIILFRLLPKDVSVEVFSELPSDDQVEICLLYTSPASPPERWHCPLGGCSARSRRESSAWSVFLLWS